MLEYVLYLKNIILEIENNIKNDDDWVNVRFDNEDLEYIKGIIRELEKEEMWELTEDMEKINDKVCKKCKYCTLVSNVIACEYILIVGKSRRCPEGYCNKFSSKKGRKKCDRGCVKRPVYKISQDGNDKVKFESLSAASEAGYSPSCIRSAIEKNRQYKGFFWEYCKNNI